MSGTNNQAANDLPRVRRRLVEMRDVADGALTELDVAVFHAYEGGMPIEEIACHAGVEVAEVRVTVDELRRDYDQGVLDLDFNDTVTWVRWYRKIPTTGFGTETAI